MKHTVAGQSNRPHRTPAAARVPSRSSIPASVSFNDNRPEAIVQRRLTDAIHHSQQLQARRRATDAIHQSPHMVAQRQQLRGMFGEAAQLQGGPEEEELLQGRFAPVQGTEAAAQLEQDPVPPKNDTGLPDNLKSGIESLSGMSMDHVKVHFNSSHPAQLNALAYAQGTDIHVAPGQEQHLPHEAWHVVQQAQGRVQPTMQMKDGVPVNDDAGLEHEADVMGARATTNVAQLVRAPEEQNQLRSTFAPEQHAALTQRVVQTTSPSMPAKQTPLRFPGVIQRLLNVNNAITAPDVVSVRKVDAKVWILQGHAQDQVVIKIEVAVRETAAQFEGRHEYVTWLAQQALMGVPDALPLPPAELGVIANLILPEGGGLGAPTLHDVASNPAPNEVYLKVAKVDMGQNLLTRTQEVANQVGKGPVKKRMMSKHAELFALISDQNRLTGLGKIAVFDLIVNNADRFGPEGTANLKNIDFNAANQPIALDNLDPNNIINDDWPGKKSVTNNGPRNLYAMTVMNCILNQMGGAIQDQQIDQCAQYFLAGMQLGVRDLKAQELPLTIKVMAEPDPSRQQLGLRILERLRALQL